MKAGRCPWFGALLLLLLGASAAVPFAAPAWGAWLLPALGGGALAAGLACGTCRGRIGLAAAALLGLVALYAGNATHQWTAAAGLLPVGHVRFLPGSACPPETWAALGVATAMLGAYALAFQLSGRQIRGALLAVVLGAVAMALLVLAQRLEPRRFPIYEYTGIFVNENHFAAFANLVLPVALVLAVRARFSAVQAGRPSSPAGLLLLGAVVLAASVVASRSRAGVAVLALLVPAHVILCRQVVRQHPFAGAPRSRPARALAWLAAAGLIGWAAATLARSWRQPAAFLREWHFRGGILAETLKAWQEAPLWGTGPGTFSIVHPYYAAPVNAGRMVLHAHCEPVQFLSEFGLLGGLWTLLAAGLALSARKSGGPPRMEIPSFAGLERRALGFGLAALGLHSLIDFPLRMPLIAVLAAAWAGLWAGTRPAAEEGRAAA